MYTVTIFRLNVATKEYASGHAAMRAVRAAAKADGLKAVTRSEPDMEQIWATVASGHLVDKDGENQWGFLVDCSEPSQHALDSVMQRRAIGWSSPEAKAECEEILQNGDVTA